MFGKKSNRITRWVLKHEPKLTVFYVAQPFDQVICITPGLAGGAEL